jgi:hypothetical protein
MKTATLNSKSLVRGYKSSFKNCNRVAGKGSASKRQEKTEDHPYLFKPTINQRSHKLLKKIKKSSQNCWETLYEDSISKKHKIDAARKQEFENEIKSTDFSFHPLIISRTKSSIDLVTRTYSWLKQKNDKINSKVEAEADKDLEGCTFTPEIHEFKDEGTHILENIKGVHKFLGRNKQVRTYLTPNREVNRSKKNISVKEYEEAVKDLSSYLHSIDIEYGKFED